MRAELLPGKPPQAANGLAGKVVLTAVTPVMNAMRIAGIVKLAGVKVGILLGRVEPLVAANHQQAVTFILVFGDGIRAVAALQLVRRRSFPNAWQTRL